MITVKIEAVTKEQKIYSFDEVKRNEGVYKEYNDNSDSMRFWSNGEGRVLFISGHNRKIENQVGWESFNFCKTNEKITIVFEDE